jgi:ABC-type transport system involved in multi-copper enzyme maturation permease subunit
MLGPIFHLELLLGFRRGRFDTLRRLYTAWLALQFAYFFLIYMTQVWESSQPPPFGQGHPDFNATNRFVVSYIGAFIIQQFVFVVLMTPAFTAGAITDEKSRGTLDHLLTAGLTSWEIILGKWAGRAVQVAVLALAGGPLICFVGVLGDLDWITFLALAAASMIPLLGLAAVSLLASVWCKQTRDAVLMVYAAAVLAVLGAAIIPPAHAALSMKVPGSVGERVLGWLDELAPHFLPQYVLEPVWVERDLGELGRRLAWSAALWGSLTAGCLGLAIARLRPAYNRQLAGGGRKARGRVGRRIQVTDDPIRWREQHVEGIAPLAIFRRVPRGVGLTAIVALVVFFSLWWWRDAMHLVDVLGIWVVQLTVLVVAIRCSGAVTGERERQTWEPLLLSPLEIQDLIEGKLRGILWATFPYLAAFAAPAVVSALLKRQGLVVCWIAGGLGATWLMAYTAGAAGLWCSARAKSSWRALLGTLALVYVGGALFFCVASPVLWVMAMVVVFGLGLVTGADRWLGLLILPITVIILYVWMFWRIARYLLTDAQRWVANRERTRMWRGGINCGEQVAEFLTQKGHAHIAKAPHEIP